MPVTGSAMTVQRTPNTSRRTVPDDPPSGLS
jgi:hypothetical protein